jgi:serine/threonine protein kinase
MVVLYALMICKYCFHKSQSKRKHKLERRLSTGGTLSGSFRREHFHNPYSMTAFGGGRPISAGYNTSTFDSRKSNTLDSTDGGRKVSRNYDESDVRQQKRRTYVGSKQFPSKNLVLLTMLAEGEFGPVYRGEAYDIVPQEASRIVTVKMLKQDADDLKRVKFEQDITLLSHLNHLNVAGVLGVCTDASPECIILDGGTTHVDLLSYVRDKGAAMRGVRDGDRIIREFRDLLKIADEICLGLAYLSSQGIVHKDVALRNCVRGQNRVVKIASFGIGSKIYPEAYYFLHGRVLPLRWMPPESISHDVFATPSDIWAFGVLAWELFTYGELPFPNLTNEQVLVKVSQQSSHLPAPDKCPEDVFLVMSSCWGRDPASRPSFLLLHQHIFDLISPHLEEDHGD